MSLYLYPEIPERVHDQLERLVKEVSRICAQNLVGIYLHGSLTMGCFNPQRSDLDLLVRIDKSLSVPDKQLLGELLLEISGSPIPVEISFLSWAQLFPWRYPTPYDFHFSEAWRDDFTCALNSGEWQHWNDEAWVDYDLAGHIQVCSQRGVCLAGLDIADAFPEVPVVDFRRSILQDVLSPDFGLQSDLRHPVYILLNACRTLAYLREGAVLSKAEGGSWGLQHLPEIYHPVIRFVLQAYAGETDESVVDMCAVKPFADFLAEQIRDRTAG